MGVCLCMIRVSPRTGRALGPRVNLCGTVVAPLFLPQDVSMGATAAVGLCVAPGPVVSACTYTRIRAY